MTKEKGLYAYFTNRLSSYLLDKEWGKELICYDFHIVHNMVIIYSVLLCILCILVKSKVTRKSIKVIFIYAKEVMILVASSSWLIGH